MTPPDRRRQPRVSFSVCAEAEHSLVQVTGAAQDLSRSGLAFVAAAPLTTGTAVQVEIQIPAPEGAGSAIAVHGEVTSAVALAEGGYRIGVRFLELDGGAEAELDAYLAEVLALF